MHLTVMLHFKNNNKQSTNILGLVQLPGELVLFCVMRDCDH